MLSRHKEIICVLIGVVFSLALVVLLSFFSTSSAFGIMILSFDYFVAEKLLNSPYRFSILL